MQASTETIHGHGAGADSADSDARVRVQPVSRPRGSDRHVPSCRVTVPSLAMGTRRGHMALGRPHAQRASAGCCASPAVAGHGRPAPITVVSESRAGGLNKGRMPVRPAHVAAARLQAGPRCPPQRLPVKRGRRRSRAVCGVPSLGGLKMHVPKIGRNVSSK